MTCCSDVVPRFNFQCKKMVASYYYCCTWPRQRGPLTEADAKKSVTKFSKLCFRHWFGFVHALGTGVELWIFLWQGKRGWNFRVPTPSCLHLRQRKEHFTLRLKKKWKNQSRRTEIEQACRYGTRLYVLVGGWCLFWRGRCEKWASSWFEKWKSRCFWSIFFQKWKSQNQLNLGQERH